MRSIAILDCNIHSQITVAHVTLPKAVPSTVKIFAVYISYLKLDPFLKKSSNYNFSIAKITMPILKTNSLCN